VVQVKTPVIMVYLLSLLADTWQLNWPSFTACG